MATARCELCGEPMPPGEGMFKIHGYSGPCPKEPLPQTESQVDWQKEAAAAHCKLDQAGVPRNCPSSDGAGESAYTLMGRVDLLKTKRDKAVDLLRSVRRALVAAPELNMSNYDEEQVAELNEAVNAVCCEIDSSGLGLCAEGDMP